MKAKYMFLRNGSSTLGKCGYGSMCGYCTC